MTKSGKTHDRPDEMLWEYMDPLRPFLKNPELNEVCVNRPGEVWTEGRTWERHEVPALTFKHCLHLATLITVPDRAACPC